MTSNLSLVYDFFIAVWGTITETDYTGYTWADEVLTKIGIVISHDYS